MTAPPRVDFYILPGDAPAARDQLGCRLAEKACKMGHKVYLHTESEAHARRLDELLWTFRAGSFLPHALLGDDPQPAPPVLIGRTGGAEPGASPRSWTSRRRSSRRDASASAATANSAASRRRTSSTEPPFAAVGRRSPLQ